MLADLSRIAPSVLASACACKKLDPKDELTVGFALILVVNPVARFDMVS